MQNIGKRLKAYRRKHRISAAQMAQELSIGRQHLYRIELGLRTPTAEMTERIAARMGFDVVLIPRNGRRKA